MAFLVLTFVLISCSSISYLICRNRVLYKIKVTASEPKSLPKYYGQNVVIWSFFPAFILLLALTIGTPKLIEGLYSQRISEAYPDLSLSQIKLNLSKVKNVVAGAVSSDDDIINRIANEFESSSTNFEIVKSLSIVLLSMLLSIIFIFRVNLSSNARYSVEKFLRVSFLTAAIIAILTTIAIIASLSFEAVKFFSLYNFFDFIFGLHWAPNIAIREDQVAAQGSFGMIPVLLGTIVVATIAMFVALPIGLFSAIYLAEFATKSVRDIIKPILEILAGIPTVVYGYFAALTAAPFFRDLGAGIGITVSSESALAAGTVMGIMIIPFISSLSDDVIRSVPQSLKDGSFGLGATRAETITKVVLPAALPGLVGAFLLAVSRAIGETMIVVMAAGLSAKLTVNPLETVTTVTVQIVSLLTGDTEFDDIKTLSAFGLGLALFTFTLLLNVLALTVSRRLAERYD
jgi:phosphate transport system permease protein